VELLQTLQVVVALGPVGPERAEERLLVVVVRREGLADGGDSHRF
jgi:hypothetical protein